MNTAQVTIRCQFLAADAPPEYGTIDPNGPKNAVFMRPDAPDLPNFTIPVSAFAADHFTPGAIYYITIEPAE